MGAAKDSYNCGRVVTDQVASIGMMAATIAA